MNKSLVIDWITLEIASTNNLMKKVYMNFFQNTVQSFEVSSWFSMKSTCFINITILDNWLA